MKNSRMTRSILGVAFMAAAVCVTAWPQTVHVVEVPAAPSGQVSVTTQTTSQTTSVTPPPQEVAVVQEAPKTVQIRHEAVMDVTGNVVDSIIVKSAPPEPKEEAMRIETRPDEKAVWLPGYWQWDAGKANHEWVSGTWRRAIPGMTWNAGHWAKVSNGYEWSPGFWTNGTSAPATTESTTTRTVVVSEAPPAPREESRPSSPGADVVWVPGSWSHEKDDYVWTSGRWERPAVEGMTWTPTRWVRSSAGYGPIAGHWDYPVESRSYTVTTEKSEKH